MRLETLLNQIPPLSTIPSARAKIQLEAKASRQCMVVLDDDPTGTQTVHDVRVLMNWSPELLRSVLAEGDRVLYISTNSRSLDETRAGELMGTIGRNLKEAADAVGVQILPVSRSDSTLRGHYPIEVEALLRGLDMQPDAIILAPAFFEGGRYTIDDIHWVDQGERVVRAHETEFARDSNFGYRHSHLKDWVEEKTNGIIQRNEVGSISLEAIRQGGIEETAKILLKAEGGRPIILNAACYEDLDIFSLAMLKAEAQGKRFLLRSAASIVKSRGGISDQPLLTGEQLGTRGDPGLIVVGSYVGRTTRQVERLLTSGQVEGIELDVESLLNDRAADLISKTAAAADAVMAGGKTPVVYTSRTTQLTQREDFLVLGKTIMDGLCEVVRRISVRPDFVLAKGGITSYEIAKTGLGMLDAWVIGQIIKGVPVWKMGGGSRWKDIPYIVYPGNVGDDDALRVVVEKLLQIG